jgi:hypothetical protein
MEEVVQDWIKARPEILYSVGIRNNEKQRNYGEKYV